jgi:hypothetical protein
MLMIVLNLFCLCYNVKRRYNRMRLLLYLTSLFSLFHISYQFGVQGRRWYIGGSFTADLPCGKTSNIAAFDTEWIPLNGGTDGLVHVVHVDQCNNVYIGGEFRTAGSIFTGPMAVWRVGAENWSPISSKNKLTLHGNHTIRAIASECTEVCECSVYFGGGFTSSFSKPPLVIPQVAINLIKWDGIFKTWDTLHGERHNLTNTNDDIFAIHVSRYFDKRIWIGGKFPGLLKYYDYDTTAWTTLLKSPNPSDIIYTVRRIQQQLVIGGNFNATSFNGVECSTLCRIDIENLQWSRMIDAHIRGYVMDLDSNGDDLVIGGWFHYEQIMNKFAGRIPYQTTELLPISADDNQIFNHPIRAIASCDKNSASCLPGTSVFGAKSGLLKYFSPVRNGTWNDFGLGKAQIYTIDTGFYRIIEPQQQGVNVTLIVVMSVLLVAILILISYCSLMFVYNTRRGKKGIERVPNIEVVRWLEFYLCLIFCGVVHTKKDIVTRPYEQL